MGLVHVMATYSDAVGRGEYQGLISTLAWSHPRLRAELALPAYRLARADDEAIGLGDLAADVRLALVQTASGMFAGGLELAFTLPTGDPDRELGMGHVMAMPGVWFRLAWEPLSVAAEVAYGRALSSTSHAQHHEHGASGAAAAAPSATPRVNPMNAEELEHAIGIRYALHPNLSLTARWFGAVPLAAAGVARQLIGPGLHVQADALDAGIEVQVPVVGDPFDFRLAVSIGAQL